ncbi:MAG TPA: PAS domain S-box protein [Pyrinomonadaceae bacterium]|nr:PAS domain S-box protein [Pyrinomonadaceae bacterium]
MTHLDYFWIIHPPRDPLPLAYQQNEQRWRTAFENSAISMMMADFAGRIFAANRAFRNFLGYTESELYSRTFLDVTYEEDRKTNLELVRELAEGTRQHFQIEKRYYRKGGTLVWARANVVIVPGTGDLAPFWLNVVEDITAQKEAQQALRKTEAELARVSNLTTLGELAASIAHEINQPLTAVTNNSNACLRLLASHRLQPEVLHRTLKEIVTDASRASAVVARLRAAIMKEPAEKLELEINDLIEEVLGQTGPELEKNGILLECRLTNALPLVLGDRVQLQQVLLNLITNAIEAMAPVANRPRLLVVEFGISELESVLIVIRDSGIGLGSDGARIFAPFFTTKANGMGMGLPISRSIAEGFGGRLWAKPNFPHGAVFSFTLPTTGRSFA